MEKMTISVIIPVFNGEKTIGRCIESVIGQTYTDWELIIVDDGSKDETLNVCERYKNKDTRVHVISQSNKGVSAARNLGLNKAKGSYILFIDADDYVELQMFEVFISELQEKRYDVICFGLSKQYENGTIIKHEKIEEIKDKDKKYSCYSSQTFGYVWNKLYKKKIIDENKIVFNSSMKIFEDEVFNCNFFKYAEDILIMDHIFYHYIQYEGTKQATRKVYLDILEQNNIRFNAWIDLNDELAKKRIEQLSYEACKDVILVFPYMKKGLDYKEIKGSLKKLRKSETYKWFKSKIHEDKLEKLLSTCISKESYSISVYYNIRYRIDVLMNNKFSIR